VNGTLIAEGAFSSQEAVELILGRLLTDARFRRRFFAEPEDELRQFELVEHERDSLRKLDPGAVELLVELLAARLDPRIRRG
jgi:hypothetical protein